MSSTLVLGMGTIPSPMWVWSLVPSHPFGWSFSWLWVVFSHICTDRYLAEDLSGTLCGSPEFSYLCSSLLFGNFPRELWLPWFPWTPDLSPTQGDTGACLGSSFLSNPGNSFRVETRGSPNFFPISKDHRLSLLVVLKHCCFIYSSRFLVISDGKINLVLLLCLGLKQKSLLVLWAELKADVVCGEKRVLLPKWQRALLTLLKVTRGHHSWGSAVESGDNAFPTLLSFFLGTTWPVHQGKGKAVLGPLVPFVSEPADT